MKRASSSSCTGTSSEFMRLSLSSATAYGDLGLTGTRNRSLLPERADGIDARGTPRRQIAREEGHGRKHHDDAGENDRVAGLHFVKLARQQTAQADRQGKPDHDPDAGQPHPLLEDDLDDV